MTTRREILLGGALILLGGSATRTCLAIDDAPGCSISRVAALGYLGYEDTFDPRRDHVISRSGNKDFDYAAAHTLSKLADLFGILPGFAFFNKGHSGNAFACPSIILHQTHPDGAVLFGRDLLFDVMSYDEGPDTAFSTICAHEFAHILQFKLGLIGRLNRGQPTVKRSELHADFLAGFFAGMRKLEKPSFKAAVYAETLHKLGDYAFESPEHHGTPEERADAIVHGFKTAYEGKHNIADAIGIGVAFVSGR